MVAMGAPSLAAQGTFIGLGQPNTSVTGISGDGTVVVGTLSYFGPAFRWTEAEGLVLIGSVGQNPAISRDGKTIASDAKNARGISSAAIWMGGTNWRTLGGLPNGVSSGGSVSTAYGVSGDGSVIVGLAWVSQRYAHAFRWDGRNGMVDLGSLEGDSSRANAISADGNVIAGWDADPNGNPGGVYDYWRGTIWWQALERLINPLGFVGEIQAVNNDGSVIVGHGSTLAPRHAYRYTAWDGKVTSLGALKRPPRLGTTRELEDQSYAVAVSDDGSVVVGTSGWKPPLDGFIYTDQTKMIKLSDFLASKGVVIPKGWRLISGSAVSSDGKTIAGTGINPAGDVEGYVARLF
jgi:probable HAF family extracellular repeat protein